MSNEKKDICVNCEKEMEQENMWRMQLSDGKYFYCDNCLKELLKEFQGFADFLEFKFSIQS